MWSFLWFIRMKKKDVVIVIPYFKNKLDNIERISLTQAFKVLKDYDITLIVPQSLNLETKCLIGNDYYVERFENEFFNSTESYSELCLSTSFYERFNKYKYMLIYQLDAFVFEDRLIDLCLKGYDYWGAPAPKAYWPYSKSHIGNGGLSLRKIDTMIQIANEKDLIKRTLDGERKKDLRENILSTEDRFISYALEQSSRYKLPSLEEAFEFSIEYNINGIYINLEKHLPFGTHRWNKYNFGIWWEIIKKRGYDLDIGTIEQCIKRGVIENRNYFKKIVINILEENPLYLKQILIKIFMNDCVSIWGYGIRSHQIIQFLDKCSIRIKKIFDKNNNECVYPDSKSLYGEKIIITTEKYENEIAEELLGMGMKINKDFFTLKSLFDLIYNELYLEKNGETI